MMRKVWIMLAAAALCLTVGLSAARPAAAGGAIVRAVLFWAEGCPHCHEVMDKALPPLQLKYGEQFQIAMIEVSGKANYDYFRQLEDAAQVPAARRGVPALFIADRILVGSQEIPRELPGLIEKYLAAGGLDWPALPGLAERLAAAGSDPSICTPAAPCPTATPASLALASASIKVAGSPIEAPTAAGPISQGFELAAAVAVFLALTLIYALAALMLAGLGRPIPTAPASWSWLILVLCVLGAGVAGYLTFVETQNVAAVCGPVGDCNAVQVSPYARLFGVVPVGLLGLAGYAAIVAAWLAGRRGDGAVAFYAPVALLAMALFGVLFSLYLTYLELAVILAVCIWCLTSAVLMALILILAVRPALAVFDNDAA